MEEYDIILIEPVGPRWQALCTACHMYTYTDRHKIYPAIKEHLDRYHLIPGMRLT